VIIIRRLVSLFTLSICTAAALTVSGVANAADDVTVQLDWLARGDHAMFFVALDQGFYAKNGINVTTIRKGTGTGDALRLVANGSAQFGFGDLPTLMVARTTGIENTALIAVNQSSPLAVISIKAKHPLKTVADLKGLNVGVHPAGAAYVFLKALLAKNGMSVNDIKQSTVSPPYENYLIMGRVDAVPGYIDAEVPLIEDKTGGPGSLSILQASDNGLRVYGSGVFTSDKMIATNPDLVQRFVNAYSQAFAYVLAHPKEAVASIVKNNPEFKGQEAVLATELDADVKHTIFSADTATHGLGWMDQKNWTDTFNLLQSQGAIDKDAKLAGGFDTRFLEKSSPLKK
jgi:NitT/TauT family transport system substrate-binding protein